MSQQRKDDHVNFASQQNRFIDNDFDDIQFIHHSLPQLAIHEIDVSSQLANHHWRWPFFINAMTGGSDSTLKINQQLAEIAATTDLAIAAGSQSIALKNPHYRRSFQILRQTHPYGFIFANLSANATISEAEDAIAMIDANALQIHLNVPQEIVMSEGDRDFRHWLDHLLQLQQQLTLPLVVKEVGFGISAATLQQLQQNGIEIIDVSGRGGTDFIAIEKARQTQPTLSYLQNWGQSCAASLLEAQPFLATMTFIASGGIRHPLDIIKALALGAHTVGVAGIILQTLQQQGYRAVIALIQQWQQELPLLMLLLGARNLNQLNKTDILISRHLATFAQLRRIDITSLAQRHQ